MTRLGRIHSKRIVASLGRDPAEVMAELDKVIKEKSKEMPVDLEIERDDWGRVKFIIKEKKEGLTKDDIDFLKKNPDIIREILSSIEEK